AGGVYLCDYDRDGIMDVLITDVNGIFLYKGLEGGKFRDVTVEVGLPTVPIEGRRGSLVAAFADLDGDGWPDLILGRSVYQNIEGPNGRRFKNVTALCNLNIDPNISGLAIADFDGDGRMDLYAARSGQAKASSWLSGKSGNKNGNQLWRNLGN